MRNASLRALFGVVVALWTLAASAQSEFLLGHVVGILDGDTVDVLVTESEQSVSVRIRLAEIDAPEKGQPFGEKSKESLAAICFSRRALVRVEDHDRYGRIVGRLWCDGLDANAYQVDQGMAWFFLRYGQDLALYGAELGARDRRVGLWSDPHPIPPWVWRDIGRGR